MIFEVPMRRRPREIKFAWETIFVMGVFILKLPEKHLSGYFHKIINIFGRRGKRITNLNPYAEYCYF
jgi:hypothetical protein